MTLAVIILVALAILGFRIWIETLAAKKRMAEPASSVSSDEPKCYKYCQELAEVEELVKGCSKTSRAYQLVNAAASRLAIPRPGGLYQWRQQHAVDDLHEEALGFLTEARELAASC